MKIKFLGTGAGEGIPCIGCNCHNCTIAREKGQPFARKRTSLLFEIDGFHLLSDAGPDIRSCILEYNINKIDAIYLTHVHYDHTGGLKEFRYWHSTIDIFAIASILEIISKDDTYNLKDNVFFNPINPGQVVYFPTFTLVPFAVWHSKPCYGFLINHRDKKIVHLADTTPKLSSYVLSLIQKTDILIIDTVCFDLPKPDHINTLQAIELKKKVKANKLIVTHFNHKYNKPHNELVKYCTKFNNVIVAYDGMEVTL